MRREKWGDRKEKCGLVRERRKKGTKGSVIDR